MNAAPTRRAKWVTLDAIDCPNRAGQASGWVAKTLRDQKFAGRVVLVGDEERPPCECPPLSKDVLLGSRTPESIYLWPRTKLAELDIDLNARLPCDCPRSGKQVRELAGLETNYRIVVDAFGRTSDDWIYAAGNVANQPDGFGERYGSSCGPRRRINRGSEGDSRCRLAIPRGPLFLVRQYETKLQILGHFTDYNDLAVRGDEDDRFTSFYMKIIRSPRWRRLTAPGRGCYSTTYANGDSD
jgi:hypothetical protein